MMLGFLTIYVVICWALITYETLINERMIVKEKIGEGKNSSDLTKDECMQILYDWNVSFNELSNADLDSLYFVANGHWAYHLPREYYIKNLNKYRLNSAVC